MRFRAFIFIFISVLFGSHLFAGYYKQEIDLEDRWSFMIGDDPSYTKENYLSKKNCE